MRVVVKRAARGMPSMEMEMEMEREPRTLSLHELNYAREAALYVLSTHSSQDAARIFTQGLKPVLVARSNSAGSHPDSHDDGDGDAFLDGHDHRQPRGRVATKKPDFATAPF